MGGGVSGPVGSMWGVNGNVSVLSEHCSHGIR